MVSKEKKSILSSTLRGSKAFITDLAYQADQRQYRATVIRRANEEFEEEINESLSENERGVSS